jgi:site-specific recombinase XerD
MNGRRAAARGDAPDLDIPDAVDRFIARKRPNWKGATERTYRKSLDTFEEYAEESDIQTLSDLERWNLGRYTDWLLGHDRDYAKATVQSKQKQTRRWVKWLESQGYVGVGLHLAIEILKLDDGEQTSDEILRPTELREFLAWYRNSTRGRATRNHALLEVVAHVAARRSGLVALDVGDWNREERTLTFRNRPDSGTRLKEGDDHERKVVLSETPAEILTEYVERERWERHDGTGRRPLFASRQGRPGKSTITNWLYQATQPCLKESCPHSKNRHNCEWTEQTEASKCPSSKSPHPARRGSITWQLNIGRDPSDVAARAATTPQVIRRYYDRPDLDAELRRRITEFDGIDICEHSTPTDLEVVDRAD